MKMRFLVFISTLILGLQVFGQSSVLANGNWVKVGITSSAVYKLTVDDLSALGLPTSSLDPQTIKVYGNGVSGILPQSNETDRPFDLIENPIRVVGEEDGSFDATDYLLFYGLGPHREEWTVDGFEFEYNIYSDTAYYFITYGGDNGLRIEEVESLSGAVNVVNEYNDHLVFEEDVNNLLNTGRGWYGDLLADSESVTHQVSIPGVSSDISMDIHVVSQSIVSNNFGITAPNFSEEVGLAAVPSGPGTTYSVKAREASQGFTLPQNSAFDLRITFDGGIGTARGFIDNYVLTFERELDLIDGQKAFRSIENVGAINEFRVESGEDAEIWNVTSPTVVMSQGFTLENTTAVFSSQSSQVEEFVVFDPSLVGPPFLFGSVANQNLKGTTNVDGIIVSPSEWIAQAERLAQFHRDHDQMNVLVVTPNEIYNEFSSGRQDVSAIRDYARYLFQEGGRLKYLLLFGDCSFDYKNREPNNTNFIPTYESRNSFHPVFSYSSDDYFGFFEEGEGEWVETSSGDHTMEIGIGRLPIKNLEEAETVVDKIIYYATSPNALGPWRNQIAYLADDGDANIHARDVESLSELIDTTHFQYRIDKLLLDAFDQEVGATRETSPETTQALKTRIKEGTFTLNFLGHGNEFQWMDERVVDEVFPDELTNLDMLPIFITATCEYGRYDDPSLESGAEKLMLSGNGGAIALLTTSRPVIASTNLTLNTAFHRNIFEKVDGDYQRLGDIIRITKNEGLAGSINRNFTLLGDPMLKPAYPQNEIVINELTVDQDTLSALEEVTFTGEVQSQGQRLENFNGVLDIVFLDEKQSFQTNGQEDTEPFTFTRRSNALFRGESTVIDGSFSFSFVVPKTITYGFSNGKMSLYAWDIDANTDAAGSSNNFVIGGTTTQTSIDETGPEIDLYLNDESFQNGSTISQSALLIAQLFDDNGITTTGNGLVQGISLTLNDQIFNLNEFYTASRDSYQDGTVTFPLQDLEPGDYSAKLSVYDTHNNLSERSISFTVSDESFLSVFNPMFYPNPVTGQQATISFEHDRESENLEMQLIIYNSQGAIVNNSTYAAPNSNRLIELDWSPITNSGQTLPKGIYYYQLIIRSTLDGAAKEIVNKIVIHN